MTSIASYSTLITRATSSDDPALIYDITDKVKEEGSEGAIVVATAVKRRFAFPDTEIKRRVLKVLDALIIECGSEFHKAFISAGFLTTLADNRDKEISGLIPEHLQEWRAEMGPDYKTAFDQAFPPPPASSSTGMTQQRPPGPVGQVFVPAHSAPSEWAFPPPPASSSTGMTQQRPPGPVGQFKTRPVNPLVPFLTMPYVRAQRVLYLARDSRVFHMQSIHIARQALHLVILLNDLVDTEEGPNDEQEDERIDLEDELIELENAMKEWGAETGAQEDYDKRVPVIKDQYAQFFKERFYFQNSRDPQHDRIYKKLLAYDKKTIAFKKWHTSHGTSSMGVYMDTDEEDKKSEAYIESVRTSPALSQTNITLDKGKGKGKEVATGDVPLSQVNVSLAEEASAEMAEGQEIEATTSTVVGAGGIPQDPSDELERARQFRSREVEENRGEQNFRCPVPGCGRTFEKQYLLKHHIREHDDRPYRCPMRDCNRRFATPVEQRVHEALHRIKNMNLVPNMPPFAPPIASTSTVPAPVLVGPQVATETSDVKSDGKPEPDAEGEGGDAGDNADRPPPGDNVDRWQEIPEGPAGEEFLKPVDPGEVSAETSTKPTEYIPTTVQEDMEDHMEEDTTT